MLVYLYVHAVASIAVRRSRHRFAWLSLAMCANYMMEYYVALLFAISHDNQSILCFIYLIFFFSLEGSDMRNVDRWDYSQNLEQIIFFLGAFGYLVVFNFV